MSDTPSTMAHPDAAKDFWLQCVKPMQERGTLHKLPTRLARTPQERETARKQNAALTSKTFGMPEGYERIFGNGKRSN